MNKNSQYISKKTLGPIVKVTKRLNLQTIKSTEHKFQMVMDSFDTQQVLSEKHLGNVYFGEINKSLNDRLDFDLNKAIQLAENSPGKQGVFFPQGIRSLSKNSLENSPAKVYTTSKGNKLVTKFALPQKLVSQNEYGFQKQENIKIHCLPLLNNSAHHIRPSSSQRCFTPVRPLSSMQFANKDLYLYDTGDGDLTPEQWMQKCYLAKPPHGQCPIFQKGEYLWVDIKVLEWNKEKNKFKVQILENGTTKTIQRLSVRFKWQDNEAFNKRLNECRKRQKIAEEEIRFMNYVDSVPDKYVSLLPNQARIKKRVRVKAQQLRNFVVKDLMVTLFQESAKLYERMMKKCFVLRDMEESENWKKFRDLRINIRQAPTFYSQYVDGLQTFDLQPLKKIMQDTFIATKQQVVQMLKQFSSKCEKFESYYLVDCAGSKQNYPVHVDEFDIIVGGLQFRDQEVLQKQWRDYLISEVQDSLREVYRFYLPYVGQYIGSELHRLVTRVEFMYAQRLYSMLLRSLQKYTQFLQKFCLEFDRPYHVQTNGLFSVTIQINIFKNARKTSKLNKSVTTPKKNILLEPDQVDEDTEDMVFLDPPLSRIKETLMRPYQLMVESIKSCLRLEKDLVPLIKRPSREALEIEGKVIDPYMEKGLHHMVDEFNKAQGLAKEFRKFSYLLSPFTNSPKTISEILGAELKDNPSIGALNVERIKLVLNRLQKAVLDIKGLCPDEIVTGLFKIKTAQAKDILVQKAYENLQNILLKCSEIVKLNLKGVSQQYQDMFDRTTTIPANEKELIELKVFVDEKDVILKRLQSEASVIRNYLNLFEEKYFVFDYKMIEDYYLLKQWPEEVKHSIKEGAKIMQQQETKFMENLEQEKESFSRTFLKISEQFNTVRLFDKYSRTKEYTAEVLNLHETFNEAMQQIKSFNEREALFKLPISQYDDLVLLQKDFKPYKDLWNLASEFDIEKHVIMNGAFTKLSSITIQKKISSFIHESMKLSKTFQDLAEDCAAIVTREFRRDLDLLREKIWVVELLTIEAFVKKPSHWKELFRECKMVEIEPNEEMTLALLIQRGILEMRETVEEISRKADKQWNLEKKLNEMLDKMRDVKIEVQPFKGSGTYIFKSVDEVQQVLDEQLNVLMMMKASPYIRGCMSKAFQLEYKIVLIQDTIEGGIKCQRTWMYLEPIFSSEDIKKKLALEKQKFDNVDKNWRNQIEIFHKEPYLWDAIESDKIKNEFEQCNKLLDQIQKSLSEYLESKRRYFPRFYFLSDEELLEILAQTKDPSTVQKHIGKCFEAINFLQFNAKQEVLAIMSQEREQINLIRPVDVNEGDKRGNIERWLSEIEVVMQDTVRHLCNQTFKDLETHRVEWVLKWPAQCILAINLIRWTRNAENAILGWGVGGQKWDLKLFFKQLNEQLVQTVDMVRRNLTALQRITLGSLVVIDVHAKDIIHTLMVEDCRSITEFKWISQLRYYWVERVDAKTVDGISPEKEPPKTTEINILVKMVNAEIGYRFEYLGNTNRLVITPLTDRCYRTLIGALHLNFGGAPEGPAGTGKTETVKDLAKAIAVQCVVFNCSDGLNYLAMSKFFKGLASSGAWCSFDEFNRIDAEVLSVIAQQIFTIQTAIKEKRKTFLFDGDEITLVPSCAINITMNPGYAGRSELPDNLKILFRPCAMMVPDYAMIAEIYLYSVGYQRARELSKKIVASMRLCTEQLSPQDHYDFGMRALKAILTCAGNLKRTHNQSEDVICLRALMNVNLPKFTVMDTPLFISITNDLFPDVHLPEQDYTNLKKQLIQTCMDHNLQPEESFLEKCFQLAETLNVRHGLMCVGTAFSGKSKVIDSLAKACTALKDIQSEYSGVSIQKLNPKAITSDQLYGKLDSDTKQWSDGVAAIILRDSMKDESTEHKWILFDGPVDAVWIENLNTVLDDNKKLCLTSGEIIKLNSYISVLFEVQDLASASPATVSRCGMVFFESEQLGWYALVKSFAKLIPQRLEEQTEEIINKLRNIVDQSLGWTFKYGKYPIHNCQMTQVQTLLKYLTGLLKPFEEEIIKVNGPVEEIISQSILFSTVWSIGAALDENTRKGFNDFLQKLALGQPSIIGNYGLELNHKIESFPIPNKGFDKKFLFDLLYDPVKNCWEQWTETQNEFKVPTNIPYHKLLIPTNDSIRNDFFLNFCVKNKLHLLLSGQTGTGKTVNIVNQLNTLYFNATYTNLQTAFSGQTTANQIQKTIEAKVCVRRRKGFFGPEDGKSHIVIFIDDLNMPAKEKYGAQPPIELLRQWMDYNGWYDLETKEFKCLQDINFVAAMLPPGGGRNSISMRYMRHYALLYVPPFDNESLKRIFSCVLQWFIQSQQPPLPKTVIQMDEQIVRSTIWIYEQVQSVKELLPTPAKAHYIYNLRDISKIFLGLSRGCSVSLVNQSSFIKLWSHECMRIFSDRMITIEDQTVFEKLLQKIIQKEWGKDLSQSFQSNSIWASFVPSLHPDTRRTVTDVYNEVNNFNTLKERCQEYIDEHNILYVQNRMSLVFFLNAIQHVARIVRIIQTTFGHALLIGMGGTGRSSLARLSSFIATQNQPHILDQRNWIEELQKLLRIVGIDGKLTTVLFHDTQIIKETMVEEVCNLLNNGEVPNLFPQEERLKIIEEVQGAPQTASPNEKYQHFVQKCKLNLHMVICMQPVGEPFRRRLRNFPALVNCTTIDWFQSWPEEALTSTASSFLLQHFEYETDNETRDGLVKVAVDVHSKVQQATIDYYQELRRFFYVTPTQYLQLLSTFQRLYARQKEIVRIQIDRYETGVDKIVATEKDVEAMRQVLFDLQPKLEKSTQENLELLRNLQIKQEEADQKKQFCEQEERECNTKRLDANVLRNDCQTQLDNVLPLLAQAAEALDKITKDDMTQLKSFTNPPPSAAVVMEGLCYAFSEDTNVKGKDKQPPTNQDFWDYAKKCLLNDKLIRRVKDFKIEQIRAIPTIKIAKLKLFSENPLFEKDKVMNASKAAGNLSLWIRSVLETYEALMIIEPKKAQLAEAEIKLKQAEEAVIVKQRALEEVLKLLAGLQQEYNIAKKEKEDIEAQVAVCQAQLSRAEKLTNGLSHEKLSWLKKSGEFHGQQKCIFGDCLLASAIISYLGVFPVAYREMCINNWKERLTLMGIKYSANFSLQHMLSDPITIGYWTNQEKLPNESFSIDNAIILKNSTRWPLMIDPQMQANTWIKCMETQRNLLVLRPTQSAHELQFQLENAIAIGYPVLLENIGQTIDQLFEPVLQQKMVRQGNSMKLRMGDKVIDYSNDFKFYMTTKLNNPHYAPQVCVMVTMLNFMVTLEGLEDQMLNIVVKMDEPAKEEQRIRNIKDFFENKNKQKATEDQILKLLYEAKGDLLNDEVLINTLGKSKIESQEIEERLKKQEHDREVFNQIRSNYRDVARRVANLYFVILDLSLVEPTYYWSLEFYILLYEKSIKESSHSKDHRSRNIIEKFQLLLYNTVCRSLLEKDKFLFSFLLTLKVMQSENRLSTQHIRFCVLGTTLSEPTRVQPQLPWITKKMWCGICELCERFPQIFGWVISSFNSNLQFWDMFYNNNSPQELEIPVKLPDQFNLFHRSILIKLIRPDKFIRIASQIITQELGKQYLEPPAFNLEQLFKESDNLTPLIFILSTGADPRHEIQSLAEKLNFTSRFVQVSLGQGQGELAEKEIKSGAQLGKWILLQNCHVAHSFMPHLEVIYEHLAHMELSKDFRLWLTSMPSSLFPHSLLLKGIKMTYEPPRGLRNNLLRSYVAIDPVEFEDCKKTKEWKALLFSLSFFHAILLERRKYGPLGWNVPYAFTSADLEISKLQLKMFLDKYSEIPWDALHYLVSSTNYGGRVTDPQDRRLIDVILKDYYSQDILEDKHKFGGSHTYYVPPDGPLESYINYIKNLPYNDPPSIFGLHPNAEIYSAILESNLLSSVVLSLLPRTTVTGSKVGTPDQQVKQRSTNILEKLPNQFDVREVGKKYPLLSNESLNTVLQQELIRYNKLINIVYITLNDLMKAIDGLVIMSPELEELYNRVFDNQVPEAWKKCSYPSLKPLGSWMTDLLDRLDFLQKWIDNGIPSIFWISGFFFTQSFLTGVLQNYSRKHKIAIDRLRFSFYILDVFKGEHTEATVESLNMKLDLTKAQSDGCIIYGLFLDGARWSFEKKILIEPETNVLFYQVPFIWFLPTHEEKLPQPDVLYECPVYKTSIRQGSLGTSGHSTNYIISIDVPISAEQTYTHWIKRSVAMLTQLDE